MLHAGLSLVLALAGPPGRTATLSPCGLHHLERCEDINVLIDRPDFLRALRHFVGRARDADDASSSKYDAAVEALHGPPEERAQAAPGLLRFGACMSHYCPDKGAVFLTTAGELQGLALLDASCTPGDCREAHYTLEVTVAPERRAALEPLARAWAVERIAADADPAHPARLVAVRVVAPAQANLTSPRPPATPRRT